MEPNNQKDDLFDKLMAWAERDAVIIIICMLTLGFCWYTIATVGDYQKEINAQWMQQWDQSGCKVVAMQPNISFKYLGGYNGT